MMNRAIMKSKKKDKTLQEDQSYLKYLMQAKKKLKIFNGKISLLLTIIKKTYFSNKKTIKKSLNSV